MVDKESGALKEEGVQGLQEEKGIRVPQGVLMVALEMSDLAQGNVFP